MPFCHLPPGLARAFLDLAHWLHQRSATRLPLLLVGLLFAQGRRTVTAWFRAAGIAADYRPAYTTVGAVGRHTTQMAVTTLFTVKPLLGPGRLRVALDEPRCGRGRRAGGTSWPA